MRVLRLVLLLAVLLNAMQVKADREGWTVNPIPSAAYDTDFGLMLGLMFDANCFGGLYPNYRHRLAGEVLVYSKHASYYMLQYDSKYLIPGVRALSKIVFDNNPLYQFYGFNGSVHEYNPELNLNRSTGAAFYTYDRKFLSSMFGLEGNFSPKLVWSASMTYWHYWIRELNWKGYDSSNTLFRQYCMAGLIDQEESDGGNELEFRFGLKYDTRDIEPTPTRGIYADLYLDGSPNIFGTGYDYFKLAAKFRQYVSVFTERLVLAYSLAYQGTLMGNPAFYTQPHIIQTKPSDGLGGATTLRGVLYNRLVGDDMAWANLEIRARLLDFTFLGRRVFGVISPFVDAGVISDCFRLERQAAWMGKDPESLRKDARQMHISYGIGGQLVIDYNLIPSVTLGFPVSKNDGNYGLYMTLDYIF